MRADLVGYVPGTIRSAVRRAANRFNVDIVRNPFPRRLAKLCALLGIRTLIDVGANSGQYATMVRAAGYEGHIVSCEPLSAPFAHLRANAARDPAWHTERLALGAEVGEVSVHIAGNSYSSSVLPMLDAHLDAAPESRYVADERAPMSTVDRLLTGYTHLPDQLMLKIDVQGYEWEVLLGAEQTLSRLAAVQVELSMTPLYDGQRLMGDIVDLLTSAGLEPWALEPGFCDSRTGRMLQCDGIFVRPAAVAAR